MNHSVPIRLVLCSISILLLPILFSFIAAQQFYRRNNEHQNIDGVDEHTLNISQFQAIMRSKKVSIKNELDGEIVVRTLEGCLEGYWQIFMVLSI